MPDLAVMLTQSCIHPVFPSSFIGHIFASMRSATSSLCLYWLSGLILSNFLGNIVFMLTSGLHKMLKILNRELLFKLFMTTVFFSAFSFFFFGLISFGVYYIGLKAACCAFS